jgi:hypothetical protein
MITLAAVAISLTIGLVSLAYGYIDPEQYRDDEKLYYAIGKLNIYEELLNYCYQHASDSANPIQDLIDKGLLAGGRQGTDCKIVKNIYDETDAETDAETVRLLTQHWNKEHTIK